MTAEVSFTKRAAAELSRRFNGLTVRNRSSSSTSSANNVGNSTASQQNGSSSSAASSASIMPKDKIGSAGASVSSIASWVVEGCKKQQHQQHQQQQLLSSKQQQNRMVDRSARIADYFAGRARTVEDLWLDPQFLYTLFFYLAPIERTVLARVCRTWRDILYQPVFWKGVLPVLHCRELRSSSGDLSATSELRKKVYLNLERRGFSSLCFFAANDDDVYDVISNFPPSLVRQVRHLVLKCCNVTDKGHEVLLEYFHSVTQLEMSGCNEVTDAGLWASLTPRIIKLTLADCINVADESVAAITQLLPGLRELNLQAYHVTDAALAFFGPQQSTNLTVLRLRSCWELTNHGLLNLVHVLPNLTVLSLSGCSKVTDDGVELLAENLRQLRVLDLSWCPRITDAALEYVACDLNRLEELTLDRCVHVTDIGVGYLSTMVNLRILYLRWCSQIRDFGLQHLCSMRSLQLLSLAGCSLLTSSGLSSLVQLRELRELELTNCPGASEELFQYLRDNLPLCLVVE